VLCVGTGNRGPMSSEKEEDEEENEFYSLHPVVCIIFMVMIVNTRIKQKYLQVKTKTGVDMFLTYLI
jgi:hypothetical protein